jgi:Helix-turn-helix
MRLRLSAFCSGMHRTLNGQDMADYVTLKANRNTKTASLLQVDWQRFGDHVRSERVKRQLSMREFEALTGVSFGTISRIENQSPCSTEVFLTLALLMNKNPMLYTRPRSDSFQPLTRVSAAR